MADRFILTHVKHLPLFQHLTPEQLDSVASLFQVLRFEPGQIVVRQNDPALGLWLLVSGQGTLIQTGQDGVERHVGTMQPGNYIGEKALFAQQREIASLQITQPAIILFLSRTRLDELLRQQPELALNLKVNLQTARVNDNRKVAAKAFENQREDETVLLMGRKHWWSFARHVWIAAILAAILIALAIGLSSVPLLPLAFLGLAIIGPGLVMFYFYYEWLDDMVIVTDQRVIHVEDEMMVFRKHVSEVPLDSVIEVSYEIPNSDPLAYTFKYGTVDIKTPGAAGNMILHFMPNPKQVQEIVFTNRQRIRDRKVEAGRAAIQAEIERSLRGQGDTIQSVPPPAPKSPDDEETQTLVPLRATSLISTHFINTSGESVYRKHLLNWLVHVIVPAMVMLGGFIVGAVSLLSPNLRDWSGIGLALGFFFGVIGVFWFYLGDWDWRNDVYVVGDDAIKIIRKRPLWFQNENDQIFLSQVDNVVSDVSGPLNSLIDRGNVMLFLVGADTNNAKTFADVHRPRAIQEEISRKQTLVKERAIQEEARRQRQSITEYLAVYHQTVAPPQSTMPSEPAPPTPPVVSPPEVNDGEQPPPPMRDAIRPPRVPRPKLDE
jgi:CRP-like cAMP-binding protein